MKYPELLQQLIDELGSEQAALTQLWQASQEAGQPATTIRAWQIDDEESKAGLERMITSAGDVDKAIQQLWVQNKKQRELKRAALKSAADAEAAAEAAEARAEQLASKMPPEAVELFEQLASIGDVEQIKAKLEAGEVAGQELAKAQRQEHLRTVADIAGFNQRVFADLDAQAGALEYEIITEQTEAGPIRRAVVRAEADADPVDIEAIAAERWSDYLPVLRAEASAGAQTGSTTTHIRQHAGNGTGPGDLVQQRMERRRQAEAANPNPLQVAGLPPAQQTAAN